MLPGIEPQELSCLAGGGWTRSTAAPGPSWGLFPANSEHAASEPRQRQGSGRTPVTRGGLRVPPQEDHRTVHLCHATNMLEGLVPGPAEQTPARHGSSAQAPRPGWARAFPAGPGRAASHPTQPPHLVQLWDWDWGWVPPPGLCPWWSQPGVPLESRGSGEREMSSRTCPPSPAPLEHRPRFCSQNIGVARRSPWHGGHLIQRS